MRNDSLPYNNFEQTRQQRRITKTAYEIARREIRDHIGRWTELQMKNGDVVKTVRTEYGPMEYPERDAHDVYVNGKKIEQPFKDLFAVAKWMCERA